MFALSSLEQSRRAKHLDKILALSVARGLPWPRLVSGTLIQRYKRFLADVRLRNGTIVTAHCANSGSMKGCREPGRTVYLSKSDNPKRRLAYTWEMIRMPDSLVGVNTMVPNRLVAQGILAREIPALAGYDSLRREVVCNASTRLDLMLEAKDGRCCFIEVKNCTLVEDGYAYFPDAVTTRGRKHLVELQEQVRRGNSGVIFFLVQRTDANIFRPADHIDPAYGVELRQAVTNGVEILVYDVRISLQHIALNRALPFEL
jgi:sugar fermentation stimulation protein A